jgi:transcriptional regulator with XRE-family HTH domain
MCTPCRQVSGIGTDRAPDFGSDFWRTDQMRDAFATRDMGTVVRTYRYHPAHGHKPLPQETVSRWLGTVTQSQLSRIESGRNHVDTVDKLVHYAQALRMPADLLWFSLPDVTKDPLPRVDEIIALPDGPLVPAASVSIGSAIADALLKTLQHYVVTDNLAGPRSLVHVAPQQLQFLEGLLAGARGKDRAHLLYVGALRGVRRLDLSGHGLAGHRDADVQHGVGLRRGGGGRRTRDLHPHAQEQHRDRRGSAGAGIASGD